MDALPGFPIGGYDPDGEPRELLKLHERDDWRVAIPSDGDLVDAALCAQAMEQLAPGILKIDHQGRTNGCEGWSLAHVGQGSIFAATREAKDLSGLFAYTESERAFPSGSVRLGANSGAFLEGGRRVLTGLGICEEPFQKFTGAYYFYGDRDPKRIAALENAKQFKLPTGITLKGWQDAWDWLKSGHGWVHIGIQYPTDWYGPQPYILPRIRNWRSRVGGHAVALSGWSFLAVEGQKYIEQPNSWQGFGKNGIALGHMDDFARLLDEPSSTIVGYSHRKLDANWRSWDLEWVTINPPKPDIQWT